MIFVSFGHDSHELLVKRLVEDLKKNNIDVWVDYDCLYGSSSWEEEIERGIKNSDLVILFLTNHSMRRPDGFCINEVSYANFYHKKILPIKIHNVTPLISISKIQWIDMSKYLSEDGSIDEELYSQKIKDIIDIIENNKEIAYDCNELDYIKSCLHPLDNESYLLKDKNFVGRTYLFDEYNKWKESNNKVFCLIGNAGSGKSSFIKELSFRDSSIVGIHFCINKNNERANIKNIFASLAYHVATQIEEYQNILFSYSSLKNIFEQEPKRMFEILFVELLSKVHLTSTKVIVIDAIDEVLNNDLDILLEIISNMSSLTPKWLKILLTSRRSLSIEQRIHNVTLFDLSNYQLETNNDIKEYFLSSINDELSKYNDVKKEQIINQLIINANGLFIYCSLLVNEINKGIISLDKIDSIPSSIYKVYLSYFDRLLAATSINYSDVRKVLEVLLY